MDRADFDLDELLARLVSELCSEFGNQLLSLILAGSAAKRKPLGPTSDVDLFVVVGTGWHQRRRIARDGVAIDLFIEPPERLDAILSARGNVAYIDALASGEVLIDCGSIGSRYVSSARAIFTSPRGPCSEADLFMMRLRARSLLEKTRVALAADPLVARYLLADLVTWAPQATLIANGMWMSSPKAIVPRIRTSFPHLQELLDAMLDDATPVTERFSAIERYYRAILGDEVVSDVELIGPRAHVSVNRRVVLGDMPLPVMSRPRWPAELGASQR